MAHRCSQSLNQQPESLHGVDLEPLGLLEWLITLEIGTVLNALTGIGNPFLILDCLVHPLFKGDA